MYDNVLTSFVVTIDHVRFSLSRLSLHVLRVRDDDDDDNGKYVRSLLLVVVVSPFRLGLFQNLC